MTPHRQTATRCGAALAGFLLAAGAAQAQRPGGGRGFDLPRNTLRTGQSAPDFELEILADTKPKTAKAAAKRPKGAKKKGPATVRLSSFRGKRPVVLFFGSYT